MAEAKAPAVQQISFGDGAVVEAKISESSVAREKRRVKKRKRTEETQALEKYTRGESNSTKGITSSRLRKKLKHQEQDIKQATEKAARAEILLPEEAGYLEAEGINRTWRFTQDDLAGAVDKRTEEKIFDLRLDTFGPYTLDYTRNGRHLVLAGRKGHVALLDWARFKLTSEVQTKETIRDVAFLHDHTLIAAAQKRYLHIYDNKGVELQVMREHSDINRVEYLPYHWLLATVGKAGWLKYHDMSTQKVVAQLRTRLGECSVLAQNPANAVLCTGHGNGRVQMWAPNMQSPLVQMLAHQAPVQAVTVDLTGRHLVSSGMDGQVKVWDVRTYRMLHSYFTVRPASTLSLSQQGMLAVGFGPHVQVWKDALVEKAAAPYMVKQLPGDTVQSVHFCPFEDVLGVGHSSGFTSMVVPGAGEPNFDTFEANPFETRTQRREAMVHSLLDKLAPDMISLEPDQFGLMDKESKKLLESDRKAVRELKEKEAHEKSMARNKMRGRSKSSKRYRKKHINIIDQQVMEKRERIARELDTRAKEHAQREQQAHERKQAKLAQAQGASSAPGAAGAGAGSQKGGAAAAGSKKGTGAADPLRKARRKIGDEPQRARPAAPKIELPPAGGGPAPGAKRDALNRFSTGLRAAS